MSQYGFAQSKQTMIPKRESKTHFNAQVSTYLPYRYHRQVNAQTKALVLNHYERVVLTVGAIVSLGLIFSLTAMKSTGSLDQIDIDRVAAKTNHIQDHNNNLNQNISNLQSKNRLKSVAQKDHLKLSEKNVRNV